MRSRWFFFENFDCLWADICAKYKTDGNGQIDFEYPEMDIFPKRQRGYK